MIGAVSFAYQSEVVFIVFLNYHLPFKPLIIRRVKCIGSLSSAGGTGAIERRDDGIDDRWSTF